MASSSLETSRPTDAEQVQLLEVESDSRSQVRSSATSPSATPGQLSHTYARPLPSDCAAQRPTERVSPHSHLSNPRRRSQCRLRNLCTSNAGPSNPSSTTNSPPTVVWRLRSPALVRMTSRAQDLWSGGRTWKWTWKNFFRRFPPFRIRLSGS